MAAYRKFRVTRQGDFCRGSFLAMGSPCELLVATRTDDVASRIVDLAATEAWRIEDKFSRYVANNIVARINAAAGRPVQVDDETADLLDFAETLYELSQRRFDITSGVLRRAWTFDGSDNVPDAALVRDALEDVGWHRARWQRPILRLCDGMQIDFGGIGKEYAVDRAAGIVAEPGGPGVLLNFGGDLVAAGPAREPDGWQVGIEVPEGSGETSTRIRLKTGALATSGDARRYLLKNGRRYGHILDPTTGWPIEGAPRSVTVAADTCTQAGMLATLAMLEGRAAESFLDAQDVRYWSFRQATPTRPGDSGAPHEPRHPGDSRQRP